MKPVRSFAGGVGAKARGAWLAGLVLFAAAVAAAGCGKPGPMRSDAADGSADADGRVDMVVPNVDARTDADAGGGGKCEAGSGTKADGQACACGTDCASGFCVDNVCCNTACTEGCKTCTAPGMVGTCVGIAAGGSPRGATTCAATAASTCGLDGKCDGAGACRKHVVGTLCKAGSCEGDAVVGSFACDGAGRCRPGATVICVPFSCNPTTGACFDECASSAQCVSGRQCVSGSCGGRMKGAKCEKNDDCVSGFCTDGVCCNVACSGPCVSCALPNREGTCWPVDQRQPDPHGQCRNAGEASCGQTGLCDGLGGCAKFPRDTICIQPTCAGNKRNTPGTCNGLGSCQAGGIQNCYPFRCVTGECTKTCETNADCDEGIACVDKTCGPKLIGQVCQNGSECVSGFCVDNVCCENACTGACRSCAVASSPGRCTLTAAGSPDLRSMCAVQAASTCGTNGKCDGNGGCQKHPVNTVCADETCVSNVYTPASMCNANGQCVAPDALPCPPFACNVNKCFTACTNDSQCVAPNTCIDNSCGLKDNGASCTIANECKSGFCAQGVCCDQACTGACKSCVAGMLGACSNVATGSVDPEARCADQGGASCGTNGRCEAGACQRYAAGTPCLEPTCPSTSNLFTALSTCNGAGACVTPAATDCFPYQCGGTACYPSCTSDAQCKAPAVCTNGTCGLKPPGAACFGPEECRSGFCEQGVCCQTACNGICKSCALVASRGTCSNKATGDTDARCTDMGPASCSTDGFCDGNGACRLYDASTSCAPPSCPTNQSTLITGRTCDGRGVCQAASSIACAPYVCNGTTACKAACTSDGDCLPGNICDLQINRCGDKKRLGQPCTSTDQCLTGNACVDGVCCSTPSCGLCQACNVSTSAGNCTAVPLGAAEPHSLCVANPPCGNTGACNGAGACQLAATTVPCGTASCTGSTFTPVSRCNGSGSCAPATASSCSPYLCSGAACRTSCTADGDCLAPFTCQGTAPNRSCALKPNGLTCTAGNQCISGNCVDGYCCGSASCPTCQACNVAGSQGMCAFMAAGAAAPVGQCPQSPPCGNTGACNGAGGCQQAATTVSCGLAMSCAGTTFQPVSFCSGAGTCTQAGTSSCGSYVCNTNATCRTNCTSDAHCSSASLYCNGNPGSCVPKKVPGAACGANNECGTGNCVDGVCCTTGSCAACQSCSVNGLGTCANVANGTADPPNCVASPPCGNTGVCVNGACEQRSASTICGAAISCTGTTFQPPSFCSGAGTCNQVNTIDCGAYQCGTNNSCRSTCTTDDHCTPGNYCTGNASTPGSCAAKKALGATCGGGNQCVSNNCVDGVCCSTTACSTCQACNLASSPGTCANVGSGAGDPHGRCAPNGECGNTGACNGNGGCTQQPSSVTCGISSSCVGSTYRPPSFCNGNSQCTQAGTQSCSPYMCGAGSCLSQCNSDGDCVAGYFCTGAGGSCVLKNGPGVACSGGNQCASGNCVDNVCCTTNACSTCQACNLNGAGTCANVGSGIGDPHGRCAPNVECGNTGVCNGAGACTQQPATVMCGTAAFCSVATYQPPSFCSGTGGCSQTSPQSCSPYVCGTGACRTTCDDGDDCASGYYCTGAGGSCLLKKSPGASCSTGIECATGNCVDFVCCNSAACTTCNSCNNAGNLGSCSPDPNGAQCSGFSCPSGSTFQPAGSCSAGSCVIPPPENCAPFTCGLGACRNTCTADSQCASGNFCNAGLCAPKRNNGDTCAGDNWCTSTHCTEGVCCGVAECPVCQSCALSGTGACTNIGNGSPPVQPGGCPNQGAASCGTNGMCNGFGNCALYPATTQCATACVLGTTFTRTYCDGLGQCLLPVPEVCACNDDGCL